MAHYIAGNLFAIVFALFSSVGFAQIEKQAKTIQVRKNNSIFSITLDANPTTGYTWFLKSYDQLFIKPLGKKYKMKAGAEEMPGAGGKEVWTFQLKPKAFLVPRVLHIKCCMLVLILIVVRNARFWETVLRVVSFL
jgi:hypothetical protein